MESIERFVENLNYQEFNHDDKTASAVVQKLQIIGEAVKNIPRSIRNNYQSIPWKQMSGMRDIVVHAYFGIDYEVVWNVIRLRLPEIKPKLKQILSEIQGEDIF